MKTSLCLALCLTAFAARAEERFDHQGAVGLLLGSGATRKDSNVAGLGISGWRAPLDIGGTLSVGRDNNALLAVLRLGLGGPSVEVSAWGGFRGVFAFDRFKTFYDLTLIVHATPLVYVGPRAGLGVQYELSSVIGVYAGIGGQLTFGAGFRSDFEATAGFHFRSYLLE